MNTKRRIHDGVAGAVVTIGVVLGYWIDPVWLLVPGLLGVTLVQSAFTGFALSISFSTKPAKIRKNKYPGKIGVKLNIFCRKIWVRSRFFCPTSTSYYSDEGTTANSPRFHLSCSF